MFSIFKKRPSGKVDLSGLRTDMHSHLLPGIDDGATDVNNSWLLINGLMELGYEKFITTPHILKGMYDNSPETIGSAHQTLKDHLTSKNYEVNIHAAAEYYLDEYFDNLLATNSKLLTLKDNLVLVEFSFVTISANFKKQLFELQIKGYQPILAHPERYTYLARSKDVFEDLKDAGCHFQVNILSLAGYYGKPTQDLALYLIKKNYVDLLGTDLHHMRHLDALRNSPQIMSTISALLDSGRLLNPEL